MAMLQIIGAVQFEVSNIAGTSLGGLRFTEEIGVNYAEQTMETTTNFIWDMFDQQNNASERKNVEKVSMVITGYKGAEAITYGETITVSAEYLQGYNGNVTWEFTSLIYHECWDLGSRPRPYRNYLMKKNTPTLKETQYLTWFGLNAYVHGRVAGYHYNNGDITERLQ
ncbi:unnamed protein product [Camellia sinensis]